MKIELGKEYVYKRKLIRNGIEENCEEVVRVLGITNDHEVSAKTESGKPVFIPIVYLHDLEPSKPAHYDTAIDTIAFAKANFSREAVEGFMRINALKYIQRYDKKNGADDIRKAIVYLNMLLEHVEGEQE